MNEPKRYGFPWLECDATDEAYMAENGMTELKDGGFVLWEDYARLKAEVERLTTELSNISGWGRGLEYDLSHARVEISFLKAEVERLRKAGTYLCSTMELNGIHDNGDIEIHERAIGLWRAAKEGKQS